LRADLHLHTTASDGRLEPYQIVALAIDIGLDVIAITDHDTVDGIIPALNAAKKYPSLTVIPGVEISTYQRDGEIHILGYFIDYTDPQLVSSLQELRDSRTIRAMKMIQKLSELGLEIKWERVLEFARGGAIGRPHIAQALIEAGYITTFQEAFEKYIGRGKPAYIERKKVSPKSAVKLITGARGLAVLAHPTYIGNVNLENLISELKKVGLAGMEVYYGKYTRDEIVMLEKVALSHGLVPTGGSDYHAFEDGSEAMIGEVQVPPGSIQQLYSLAEKYSAQFL
jgi:predicted metal-dependent phosphoesterase TrpH